jgi:hypothetical protein
MDVSKAPPTVPDRIRDRHPLSDHDGASGALLERAVLDDGTRLVLKTFDPVRDLTMRVPRRTVPLEVELWRSGVLDRLPPRLGHTVVGAWQERGNWLLAMRDVSDTVLSYESRVTRDTCASILRAADAMHQAFRGGAPAGTWSAADRIGVFSPRVMSGLADSGEPLAEWVMAGWSMFDSIAPPDVRDLVALMHERPQVLTDPLTEMGGRTLLHGDYWLPNIALEPDRIVAIDWALATAGPPAIEFVSFLVGCASQVDASPDLLLADIEDMWGERHPQQYLTLGLLGGVVEMGWNLAYHATENPDTQSRDAFEWWVEAARRSAATGLLRL